MPRPPLWPRIFSVRTFLALILAAALPQDREADLIDGMAYPDDAAARAAWSPMGATAPAAVATQEGVRCLRLPCNFLGTGIERASWDRAVRLDLASARGVRFRFFCPDLSPVSHFSFYLQSGRGWYSASFAPAHPGWNVIHIDKEATGIEGTPAGWGQIRTIRLSAWRGADADTVLYLADLRREGADARVAVVRADSVARSRPGEADSVRNFSEAVTRAFRDVGVPYALLSDLDVSAETLRDKKVVVLPHNPEMPEEAAGAVARFLEGGGRMIAFYGLPGRLAEPAGIEPGAYVRQKSPGQFASMRFAGPLPAGMPAVVGQRSWNIRDAKPRAGRGRIAAATC